MIGTLLRRGILVIALVLAVTAAGLFAFAYLPALGERRQALAIDLLERLVDRPVTVEGAVVIRPAQLTDVSLSDVRIGDAGPNAWRGTIDVAEVSLRFPTLDALFGRFSIDHLAASGLVAELETEADGSDQPFRPSSLIAPLVRFLGSPLSRSIALEDIAINRRAGPDGWSGEVMLEQATAGTDEGEGRTIALAGTFNDQPFTLDALFSPPTAADGGPPLRTFTIRASLPGIDEVLDGTIDEEGETLSATVALDVASIGDLLETVLLRRQLEGTARLRAQIDGPVDALTAKDIRLDVALASGETGLLQGRIANLSSLTGIELEVAADLERADGGAAQPSEAVAIELKTLTGRATGSAAALTITDLQVQTNIASADLVDIGPIGVERVTRDEAGRLGLQGLTIKNGDPASPSLDLRGSVDDLLAGEGIELAGRFDLDLLEIATGQPAPPEIGHLVGELALSDASGGLQLVWLEARQSGDGPLALTLTKPAPGGGDQADALALTLDVPDIDALAALQGAPPIGGGSAGFEGTLDVGDGVRFIGRGHVGSSPIWLDVQQNVVDGTIVIRGATESRRLLLADLPRVTGLATLVTGPDEEAAEADERAGGAEIAPDVGFAAEIDTRATIVNAAGAEQGSFNGRLTVRDGSAVVSPLELTFLGGRATAEIAVELGGTPPPARLDAQITALDTAALLAELGINPLLTGPLDATLALRASGEDTDALLASLDGMVALSMGEGRIGSRLIDLTGQNLVGWLFSSGTDTRLRCAAARLAFAAGDGRVEGLLLKTENVQLLGTGSVDLAAQTLDLTFDPQPVRGGGVQTSTPFRVHGAFASPTIDFQSAGGLAGRAIVETLTLPLNVLGAIFGGGGNRAAADCTLEE